MGKSIESTKQLKTRRNVKVKIAMLGSGATGSVFASYLKMGGADDIVLVDLYKDHMDKVAKDGMKFTDPRGTFHLEGFKTAYSAENIGIVDIAIIMVKATQTEELLEKSMACIGEHTVVATLQNGLGNDEHVKKFVPADRVLFGCGNMGTELHGPGVCVAKPLGGENMYFGASENSELTEKAGNYLKECFEKGGLSVHFYDDVRPAIWKKATSNAGMNTVCAVLRLKVSEVMAHPCGSELVWSIWKEASDVSEAMGIEGVWEFTVGNIDNLMAAIGNYYPSMAQDMLFGKRQTEVTALTGAVSDYGRKYGVPTPVCDVLTKVVKAIEANYDKQVLQ